jgi:hypothetical protein
MGFFTDSVKRLKQIFVLAKVQKGNTLEKKINIFPLESAAVSFRVDRG